MVIFIPKEYISNEKIKMSELRFICKWIGIKPKQYENKLALKQRILKKMEESDEKYIKYKPVLVDTPEKMVKYLYNEIFEREPDEQGFKLYVGMLKRKEITFDKLRELFIKNKNSGYV